MRHALGIQKAAEDAGGLARVTRRVAGVDAGEGLQELDLPLALGVEPAQQLLARAHARANDGGATRWTTTPFLITPRHGMPPIA